MSEDARAMELLGTDYQVDDGVEKLLAFIRKRLHITDLHLETEAFDKYFSHLARKKGETLMKYINAEETAYRKLQRILKSATEVGEDEYSSDDGSAKKKSITQKITWLALPGTCRNSSQRTQWNSKSDRWNEY